MTHCHTDMSRNHFRKQACKKISCFFKDFVKCEKIFFLIKILLKYDFQMVFLHRHIYLEGYATLYWRNSCSQNHEITSTISICIQFQINILSMYFVFYSDFWCLEGGVVNIPPHHLTYIFNPTANRVNILCSMFPNHVIIVC